MTSLAPDSKWTYEKLHRLPVDIEPANLWDRDFDFATIGYLPTYGSIDTLRSVLRGASLPAAPGAVHVGSALGASEIERIIFAKRFGAPAPTWAPKIRWVDAEGSVGASSHPRITYWTRLFRTVLRDKLLRLNPPASYTPAELSAREKARREAELLE